MLPLSHRLSGKFSLPRQLVPDIGKMLEKIKNPGPGEKFPYSPGPIFFPLTFQVFQGAWQPCSTVPEISGMDVLLFLKNLHAIK